MKINEGLSVWLVGEALGYAIVALAAGCLVSLLHDAAGALTISSNRRRRQSTPEKEKPKMTSPSRLSAFL